MNLNKLYRPVASLEINKETIPYQIPGIPQLHLVYGFLVEGLLLSSDLSKSDLDELSSKEVLAKSVEMLQLLASQTEEEQISIFTVWFCSPSVGTYLFPLIRQCFPEIEPEKLQATVLLDMTTQIITDILENSN